MKNEIIHELNDYITVHEKYKESIEFKALKKLTKVYNELLDIAEKNADDYYNFRKECSRRNIFSRFDKVVKKCRQEFEKHI